MKKLMILAVALFSMTTTFAADELIYIKNTTKSLSF